jgi:hypothetical protein
MRVPVHEIVAGDTIRPTCVNTGSTMSPVCSALFDASSVLVSSIAATASGNGAYYGLHLVNTPGWYVNQWISVINANTYVKRQFYRAYLPDVDAFK